MECLDIAGQAANTELGRPFVSHNQNGRLEVFATTHGAIFNIWQVAGTARAAPKPTSPNCYTSSSATLAAI